MASLLPLLALAAALAFCGCASAAQIRALLERFPRLTCDLGHMTARRIAHENADRLFAARRAP